jgi:hypothetical protein
MLLRPWHRIQMTMRRRMRRKKAVWVAVGVVEVVVVGTASRT